jgi:D-lactate dehydrogenase (cytochrome)
MDNKIIPENPDINGVECPVVEGPDKIREGYMPYLADESRIQGEFPKRIYFPRSTPEVSSAVRQVMEREESMTIGGARTGLVGGAVPMGCGNLLCTENIRIPPVLSYSGEEKAWRLKIGAGTSLEELQKLLDDRDYNADADDHPPLFYPVDPTEQSCSLGGNIATNASGARTLYYGPTRCWVFALTVVMADGRLLRLRRESARAKEYRFLLITGEGRQVEVLLPKLTMPDTKHVAGYYVKKEMDLLDLFIGGEGTLGIVTEMELKLLEKPLEVLYLCIFLSEKKVIPLIRGFKGSSLLDPTALEYMDYSTLRLLERYREEQGEASGVPSFSHDAQSLLYVELTADKERNIDTLYEALADLLAENNIDLDSTWSGLNRKDGEAMKTFRHAIPERINSLLAERKTKIPGLTKIATDMAVPDSALEEMMDTYRMTLDSRGLEYYIFGHIGNGHLHVNVLPRDSKEMALGKDLYMEFAEKAVSLGGSVAAEHGIGRLKKDFLKIQYSDEEIDQLKRIKEALDPKGILNPGLLF